MEKEFKDLELNQEWVAHYNKIIDRSRNHSSDAGGAQPNQQFNRYLDVKPYDKTRVKLIRTKDNDYINANIVTVPKAARQYILTQGPLPETISHFWLMVWEQKSNVIVMLNRILEMEEFVKCEQYWPDSIGETLDFSDVKLGIKLVSVENEKHFTVREILLEDHESDKSRTILQFHYTAWPDHCEPDSPTSFLRLLTAIRRSGGLDKMDEPTIVHCSAGIGRSGTFCLIDSVLSMVENQGTTEGIDIANTLIELRDYRQGLIQSPIQLKFAYMTIIYGIKILENANKLHPHISSIKDNTTPDITTQTQQVNGSKNNGKRARRNRKKVQNPSQLNSLNIFKKHLLVEALDDIDSDSADTLFENTMKHGPDMKKPRNSSPVDFNNDYLRQNLSGGANGPALADNVRQQEISAATKAEMLTNAINSLLAENTISTNSASSADAASTNDNAAQNTDSVLLRRRERELRNQRLAEKTMDIKNRMKIEELKREQYAKRAALLRKSAIYGGVAALVLSSIAYLYLGHSSS